MRRLAARVGLASLSIVAFACVVPEESVETPPQEKVVENEQQIFGGSVDTANDAVVFLTSDAGYSCSGTIISKNGSTGYVLTAAHCDGMDYIIQDDNLSCLNDPDTCDAVYFTDQQIVHPDYNGDPGEGYDFSIIRFSGATASTPVIPAATSPDGVSAGVMVEHVGYGVTENGQTNNRMHVTTPVDEVYSLLLIFDQTNGLGTCSGDSGGPAIRNGTVVGVTSFGDENCVQFGGSGRVAAVYNDFIAPIIGGQVVENCDTCFDDAVNTPGGACDAQVTTCFNNPACEALIGCLNECGSNAACQETCIDQNPNGVNDLSAIIDCYCTACATLCVEECGGSTTTTTTSTGANMSAGGGTAEGGASASGGASNEGGDNAGGNGEDGEDEGGEDGCGCATVGAERSNEPLYGLAGFAFAAAVAMRRRRRRA